MKLTYNYAFGFVLKSGVTPVSIRWKHPLLIV